MCVPKREVDELNKIQAFAKKVLPQPDYEHFSNRFVPLYGNASYNYYRINRGTNVLRVTYYLSNIIAPVVLITQNQTLFNLNDMLQLVLFWGGISLNLLSTIALTIQDRWKMDQKSLIYRDYLFLLNSMFWQFAALGGEYAELGMHANAYSLFSQLIENLVSDNFRREQRLLASTVQGQNSRGQTVKPSGNSGPVFVNHRMDDASSEMASRSAPVHLHVPVQIEPIQHIVKQLD